mmetsp:Transcript_57689/g.172134  ORF Transcript_57689/g.172134 Transcript_57689/m.172134 type:complete len:260 (-) Transcript_57689:241-1020(-)
MQAHNVWHRRIKPLHVPTEPHPPPRAGVHVVLEVLVRRTIQYDSLGEGGLLVIQDQNRRLVEVLLTQSKSELLLDSAEYDGALLDDFPRVVRPLGRFEGGEGRGGHARGETLRRVGRRRIRRFRRFRRRRRGRGEDRADAIEVVLEHFPLRRRGRFFLPLDLLLALPAGLGFAHHELRPKVAPVRLGEVNVVVLVFVVVRIAGRSIAVPFLPQGEQRSLLSRSGHSGGGSFLPAGQGGRIRGGGAVVVEGRSSRRTAAD